jgi:hypothetical protein
MPVTFDDKNAALPLSDDRRWARAVNLNELKAVINALETALAAHEALTNNPHTVTKTQVGLSNVDNTSDADKPVSTAQQTAIDLKVSFADWEFNEVPTGTINGVNDTFTIANAPVTGKIMVFADGVCVKPSGFSLTGTTLELTIPPDNSLTVTYIKA